MEELERQKEKYNALEKTWMAANQQFMEFQVSPDRPERSEWSRDDQSFYPVSVNFWNFYRA